MNDKPRWFTISRDIRVIDAGHIRTSNIHPSRNVDFWALVIVNSGVRSFRLYGEDIFIKAGEFFILPPMTPHQGVKIDTHDAFYFHFLASGREVEPPTKIDAGQILLPQYGKIPDDIDCQQIMEYSARLCMSPFSNNSFLYSQVLAVLFQISFFQQRYVLWRGKNMNLTEQILQFIRDNLVISLNSADYENHFKKTYRQLNKVFAQQYKMSIKQMHTFLRIKQAKRMLSSGYSISETSQVCGFSDYFYFVKVFHKITNMTPGEYRQIIFSPDEVQGEFHQDN